jgi:hypothetical protein
LTWRNKGESEFIYFWWNKSWHYERIFIKVSFSVTLADVGNSV